MKSGGMPPVVDNHPWIDHIGADCRIANSVTIWRRGSPNKPGPKIEFQDGVIILANVRMVLPNETEFSDVQEYLATGIRLGNRVIINSGSYLSGEGGLDIEDEVLVGPNVCILTGGHDIDGEFDEIYRNALTHAPVHIAKGAWLGASSIVLPGRKIGAGAVVAAGAVVTHDVPPLAVVVGNPARIVRYRGSASHKDVVQTGQADELATTETFANLRQRLNEQFDSVAFKDFVVEQGAKIISLNRSVTERDGQISGLNQAVAERDGQIAGLNQTVGGINQVVAERDGLIATQSLKINSMDIEMQKFVKPAYLLKALISQMNRRFRMDYLFKIERLILGKRSKRILGQQVELINGSSTFNTAWYLEQNPDVAAVGIDPLVHYLRHGAVEGRKPSPLFDSHWYLEQNPDVVAAGINPLVHFILFGAEEGRQPKPRPFRDMKVLCENLLRKNRKPVGKIRFTSFDAPKVSVIIPIYNQVHYTLQCLESIRRYLPAVAFEVIVVDDCSSDDSAKKISAIDGLKIITNKTNQGFIRSCNIGAKSARGEYLHFLNNDTEVTAGWLDELVGTFQEFPGTGFVGSKLVYPDGSLQEAGGIIWQDGSAWNFGRNQDPQLPVYNYAREVDYCSGASIMVPKALFEELDGFDERYLPAYCEDSDIALKIRDKGYRVIYQPLSTVVHYEGITSGTDTTQGVKAYQIENTKKLYERWKNRLQTHQPAGVDADNAKDRRATRRVLVVDLGTPMPNQDAGSVTVFNLMMLLREMDFQVTFIPEENLLYMPEYTTALQRAGIEMLYAPYINNVEQHLRDVGDRYDLVFLFRPMAAERHLKTIRKLCPKAKVLYHTVDLHFLRMMREAELLSDNAKQIAALDMKQREFAAIRGSDASIVHSTAEFELLRPELPDANLHVFPLILDVHGTTKTFSERKDIVFVGGYGHPPNVDAVQYFVSEIMPLFRPRLPGVRFHVVGSNPPAEIKALASEDVIIVGFAEDLNPLLDRMRVSVAPLRYGAGIKGKVGTAMAVGLPVVAAPTAAEGMSLTDGENILVANGAKQFADAVVSLYQDEVLWNRISHNSIEFAENAWGAEAALKILSDISADMGIGCQRGKFKLSLYSSNVMPSSLSGISPNIISN